MVVVRRLIARAPGYRLCATALALGAVAAALLDGAPAAAQADPRCSRGYAYVGVAGWQAVRGVAATLSVTSPPQVGAGHVAAWVGVGRGLGPGGTDAWIQAGLDAFPDGASHLYTEFAEPGRAPVYRELARVRAGESHRVAVVMAAPERWSVLLDGHRVSGPVHLPGSGHWRPVATAESWTPAPSTCNLLGFRFDHIAAISGRPSTWAPLTNVAVLERHDPYVIKRAGASFVASSG